MCTIDGENKEEQQDVESREIPYLSQDIIARIISGKVPYLSQDIIARIITKVPSAQSVFVTFRYVCKPWFNMITNDIPLLMHPINLEPSGMIIQSMDNCSSKYFSTLSEEEINSWGPPPELVTYTTRFFKLDKERNEVVEQAAYDLNSCFKYTRIVDSFHGLILATDFSEKDRFLVNPVTKQRLKLPPCLSEHYTKFIYISSTREYKVLQLLQRQDDKRFYVRIARLFSGGIGDLVWKFVEVPKYIRTGECSNRELEFSHTTPLAINGILYLTPNDYTLGRKYIACFDANEEKFYKIAHPDYDPHFNKWSEARWYKQLEGSLGYMRFDTSLRPDQDQLNIYILKDAAGVPANCWKGKEWMKQYSICFTPSIMRLGSRDNGKADFPLCTLRDGEIIIFCTSSSCWEEAQYRAYDLKLNQWWNLGIDLEHGMRNFAGLHAQKSQPVLTSPALT